MLDLVTIYVLSKKMLNLVLQSVNRTPEIYLKNVFSGRIALNCSIKTMTLKVKVTGKSGKFLYKSRMQNRARKKKTIALSCFV